MLDTVRADFQHYHRESGHYDLRSLSDKLLQTDHLAADMKLRLT